MIQCPFRSCFLSWLFRCYHEPTNEGVRGIKFSVNLSANVKFSLIFSSKYMVIWKESVAIDQKSLKAFFHAFFQITNSPKSKNKVSKEFRSNKKGKNYPIHHPSDLKRTESDNNTFCCLPLTKHSLNQEDKGCLAFPIQVYIKCPSVKGRK